MSITATAKILTFDEASDKAIKMFQALTMYNVYFTAHTNPEMQWFHFVSLKDADSMKHYFPESEINLDTHKRRYAELFIKYE